MARFDEKSILKTKDIRNVLLKRQDYNFQDFHFKVISRNESWNKGFYVEVYDFDVLILKLEVDEVFRWVDEIRIINKKKYTSKTKRELVPEKFKFRVLSFNPQTNNDVQSINHIIATFKDMTPDEEKHEDRGNCAVLNNQYVFRRKDNYYTYTKIWKKGNINRDNFDVDLSHEFATEEYINYVKKIYDFKIIQRRSLKSEIKQAIEKACSREKKKKLFEKL